MVGGCVGHILQELSGMVAGGIRLVEAVSVADAQHCRVARTDSRG